jgi:hypothetical protein
MNALFAMSLPALVILLIVGVTLEIVLSGRRRGRAAQTVVGSAAIDVLGLAFAPSTRHRRTRRVHG